MGLGFLASQAIEANTRIWSFTPGFDLDLDPNTLEHQPTLFRETMSHYGYIDPRRQRFILCCDDYRFINHSDAPNVQVDPGQGLYGIDFAARDIQAGEELTVDYRIVEGRRPSAAGSCDNGRDQARAAKHNTSGYLISSGLGA
jgi:SET domain-containing protein